MVVLLILALPVFSSGEGVSEFDSGAAQADSLPVSRVTMYTAGLAHVVHETSVTDDEMILFPVEPGDINDILKSLVVEDLDGGTIDVVNFDSSDPLSVILGNLRVNPSGAPPLADFLAGCQGEWVTVSSGSEQAEGRIFSIEKKQTEDGQLVLLNLLNSSGIKQVSINSFSNIKFTDPALQAELESALKKISADRIKAVRTLKISFRGSGERRVRLSYIRAVPLWKTSYRIVIDESGTSRLEGWAIVQNTGSTAWNNIQLGFVAGRPNAFTMDLSTPRYVTRENISTAAEKPIGATAYERSYSKQAAPAPSARAYYDESYMAMEEDLFGYAEAEEPYTPAANEAQASAVSSGNFYRYDVNHPVTIEARSSAMIPIIQYEEAGKSLGVYDPSYSLVFKGIELKNGSNAQWAAGPATILEGRYYGGDALIPEMIPESSRLITYAVHGSVEVDKSAESGARKITGLRISGGILQRTEKMKRETVYNISGDEDKILLIHPKDSGWKLIDSPQDYEETSSEYRFSLTEWDKPIVVSEEYTISNQYALNSMRINDIGFYLEWDGISDQMKKALNRISSLKRNIETIKTELNSINSQISRITRDQGRIRENMKVLDKESDLFKRYSEQLESQETEITDYYSQQQRKQGELNSAEERLSEYISDLEI